MSVTASSITERADRIEFAAEYDLWAAASDEARSAAGLIAEARGNCLIVGTSRAAPVPMLNRVMGATVADIEDGSLADAIMLLFDAGCVCQVRVHDEPPDAWAVREWLVARGFEEGYAWMKFVHEGDGTPPPHVPAAGVRVRPCDDSDRERFGTTLVAGYELPAIFAPVVAAAIGRQGWRCYLAETVDGQPIGVGAMFVDGDTAWLGLGATVPAARRMGAQGALLRARIEAARDLGCTLIVTETGERVPDRPSASYRNILRAGFVEHSLRHHLVGSPPGE